MHATQLQLFEPDATTTRVSQDTSSTFADNTQLPVHRWYRFSAGFSASWAESLIRTSGCPRVFDPFAGCGTTLLAAEDAGAEAIGLEAHPFVYRVARAKLLRGSSVAAFQEMARSVRSDAVCRPPSKAIYPPLVHKCYPRQTLADLDALRGAVEERRDDSPAWQLVWLTLVCILRVTSPVGTAQWQYVLPRKSKKHVSNPFAAFDAMVSKMTTDMRASSPSTLPPPRLLLGDARECADIPHGFANLVVTSPPYPNNYDYADATRLEMCFLGEIQGWVDLQTAVRRHLIRSCSQHVPERSTSLDCIVESPEIAPIRIDLVSVCERLAEVRQTKGGKKTYHLMVASYFHDLARVWLALRRVCARDARVCFVVGDSAPYGVYVPVIDWLGALAVAAGFKCFEFERTRDRNIKG